MINNFKKGDTVSITLNKLNTKNVMEVNGVIGEISDISIKIYHNFSGKKVIDYTMINIKNIIEVRKVVPIEIHSLNDLTNS